MEAAFLSRLERALREERTSLRRQLADHGADPDRPHQQLVVDLEGGFADSAHTTAERSGIVALVEGLLGNLAEVERALRKVESGSGYGDCERCGRPIAPERLEALPWARLCIECKQRDAR